METARLGPTPDMFRSCLGNMFTSDIGHETATLASLDDSDRLALVPPFTLQKLGAVLTDLHYGKAADADGMVAERLQYSCIPLQICVLDIHNSMIASGSSEMLWQHTLFSTLPKSGDSSRPTIFFFRSHLFPQTSLVQTVLLGSLQAHDKHEGQKSRAHAGAYEGGGSRLEGGGSAGVSARIWLQLG